MTLHEHFQGYRQSFTGAYLELMGYSFSLEIPTEPFRARKPFLEPRPSMQLLEGVKQACGAFDAPVYQDSASTSRS